MQLKGSKIGLWYGEWRPIPKISLRNTYPNLTLLVIVGEDFVVAKFIICPGKFSVTVILSTKKSYAKAESLPMFEKWKKSIDLDINTGKN